MGVAARHGAEDFYMVELALAVDMGGTQMRVALVDRQGQIVHRDVEPTLADQGRDDILERMAALLRREMARASQDRIVGIGASVPGPTDTATGTVYHPANLPGWGVFSPTETLEQALSQTVTLANDGNLAALAEHRYGAGRGSRHVIYMTISTGIGGGLVLNNRLYLGSGGFAGEIGHMTIDRNGPRCQCGNFGCLEVMASGTAIARMARERLSSERDSEVLRLANGDADGVDAPIVFQAAKSGDRMAAELVDEASFNLGIGIASLLNIFNPEVIVVGGGVSENLDVMIPQINRAVEERAMPQVKGPAPLVKAGLGDSVSLVGAGALAFAVNDGEEIG